MSRFKWFNNSEKTRFLKIDTKKFKPFTKTELQCMQCGEMVKKPEHKWVEKCKQCGALISFFMPTPIQKAALAAEANVFFNIGAVGSGKTTIASAKNSAMTRSINFCRGVVAAQTLDQLKRTAAPELEKFFHESEFVKKTEEIWVFKNGSVIEWWTSDNADKLRSVNANWVWLVEANPEHMRLFFNEATSRIRNQTGIEYEYDENGEMVIERAKNGQLRPKIKKNKNYIIVEGNPKRGAWFNNAILQSHTILYTPQVRGMKSVMARAKPLRNYNEITGEYQNANMIGFLNATIDNPTLPDSYFDNMRLSCATEQEYEQKVYCDITSQDGLVFKEIIDNSEAYFIEDLPEFNMYDPNLAFVESLDPGGSNAVNDPDAYLLGIFDKMRKRLYILETFKLSGLTLEESVERIQQVRRKWWWRRDKSLFFAADNALGRSSKQDREFSLKNAYQIRLNTPITLCNDKNILTGVNLLKQWFKHAAIYIYRPLCEDLINEMYGYEVNTSTVHIKGSDAVKEVAKFTEVNNHCLDAFRYMVVTLENFGFRQDQAMIDYVQRYGATNPQASEPILKSKFDIREYLPGGSNKPTPVKTQKTIKF